MGASLFGFLDGASAWWWLALGIALMAMEMLVPSFMLIWPGLAAVTVALVLLVAPELSGNWQVAAFAILAIGYTFGGRAIFRARGQVDSDAPQLNRRTDQMIGRHGTVMSSDPGGDAKVEVDGIPWEARFEGEPVPPGSRVRIVAAEGMLLRVAGGPA